MAIHGPDPLGNWWVKGTFDVPGRGLFAALWPMTSQDAAEAFASDPPAMIGAARWALEAWRDDG